MDLRRLEYLVAVVDHGGFSAAARALHVAQPSVSLAVKELEREVGATLLVRVRGGAVPTPAGEALLGPARRALRDVETAAAAVRAVTGLVAGRLDVAALPTLAADPVAELVGRFRREHEAVTVRLRAPDDPVALAAAVRDGRSEIGITESGAHNDALSEVALSHQVLVAVGPPGSAARRGPLDLAQLAAAPLVLTPVGTSMRALVDGALAAVGVEPVVAVETDARDALLPLVVSGAGTTFLPEATARRAAPEGAVVRRTRPELRRALVLVHRPGALSPAARRFVEIAGE